MDDARLNNFTICQAKSDFFLDNLNFKARIMRNIICSTIYYSFQMCFSVIEYPFWSWKVAFSIVPKLGIFYALIFNHFDNSSYKGLSTVLQKGIFMNPTRGFAVVLTGEFLFVTTWVISFFASLHHSIFWTGKLLNANRTLFEECGNS